MLFVLYSGEKQFQILVYIFKFYKNCCVWSQKGTNECQISDFRETRIVNFFRLLPTMLRADLEIYLRKIFWYFTKANMSSYAREPENIPHKHCIYMKIYQNILFLISVVNYFHKRDLKEAQPK